MNLLRIKAVIFQEIYHTRHSLEVIMDLPFFSVMNIAIFGFITSFLSGSMNTVSAKFLLLGVILWEIIRVTQYSVSLGIMWNIWSRNLSNMFITPLRVKEFVVAHFIAGTLKALLIFLLAAITSIFLFDFNIFSIGLLNLVIFSLNLTFFAYSIGIFLIGLIFRFGTKIQALAWGVVYIFQPLMATFFPVSILPEPLKSIALALPPTYVFESARAALTNTWVDYYSQSISFGLNIVYFLASILFFSYMFKKSKETGQFARNEG